MILWVIIVIALILIIISTYIILMINKIKLSQEKVNSDWEKIDKEIQKKVDISKRIIEIIKENFFTTDNVFLNNVEESFRKYYSSGNKYQTINSSDELSKNMKTLFNNFEEKFENMNTDEFLNAKKSFINSDKKINYERNLYNSSVEKINLMINKFPSSIPAKIGKIKEVERL